MKRLPIILAIALITSCKSQPFTGRVVDKEYAQGHMCHSDNFIQIHEAAMIPSIIVPHVTTPPPHHHSWQQATVTVWVANRDGVRQFSVDSTSFKNWILGSKVTFE